VKGYIKISDLPIDLYRHITDLYPKCKRTYERIHHGGTLLSHRIAYYDARDLLRLANERKETFGNKERRKQIIKICENVLKEENG
jgi:hypothetical protein